MEFNEDGIIELVAAIIKSARHDILKCPEGSKLYNEAVLFMKSEVYSRLTLGRDGEEDLKQLLRLKKEGYKCKGRTKNKIN